MRELANCPFCGGEAERRYHDPLDPYKPFGLIVDHAPDCWLSIVLTGDDDVVAAAWGRRAAPPIGTLYRNDAGEIVAVVVPAAITAETGHKAALSGEFVETIDECCIECGGSGYADGEDCEFCDGHGSFDRNIGISWSSIKAIHQAMLAALPEPE